MKKIISLILTVFIMLGLCACGEPKGDSGSTAPLATSDTAMAAARTYSDGQATPLTLDNTYYKLTREKKLNVAYVGGSVTVGTGSSSTECWRAYTQEWFKQAFPQAEITETYAAIGATGTALAITRLEEDIIQHSPDLVFIEFSVNDKYKSRTYAQSAILLEGMIHKINRELPNTDIVVITVVDKDSIKNGSENARAHRDVALYNGITYMDMTEPLETAMQSTGKDWDYYINDYVHPNKRGYRVLSDYITEKLDKMLKDSATREVALKPIVLPEKTFGSNPITQHKVIVATDLTYDEEMWKAGRPMRSPAALGNDKLETIRAQKGATLKLTFQGAVIMLVGDFQAGSRVRCQIDGGHMKMIGGSDDSGAVILYDNLDPNLQHTLAITVEGGGLCGIGKVFIG